MSRTQRDVVVDLLVYISNIVQIVDVVERSLTFNVINVRIDITVIIITVVVVLTLQDIAVIVDVVAVIGSGFVGLPNAVLRRQFMSLVVVDTLIKLRRPLDH